MDVETGAALASIREVFEGGEFKCLPSIKPSPKGAPLANDAIRESKSSASPPPPVADVVPTRPRTLVGGSEKNVGKGREDSMIGSIAPGGLVIAAGDD